MTTETPDLAAQARERGNSLYKKGNLAEAEVAYNLASTLAPNDPAPISNLSAVNFEMGHFEQAAEFATKALSLSQDSTQEKKDKLLVRLAKAHLYANDPAAGLSAAEKLTDGNEKTNLLADLKLMLKLKEGQENFGSGLERKRVVTRLPRYRPSLRESAEYYAVGHDEPESLFDPLLLGGLRDPKAEKPIEDQDVAFLFAGVGDGRNMYETMTMAAINSRRGKQSWLHSANVAGKPFRFLRSLHITILDLKSASLAKNLLILDLFSQYHAEKKKGADKKTLDALTYSMAYIYVAVAYPAFVHEVVQKSLARLVDAIEAGKPISSWVFIPEQSRAPILHYLKQWHGPAVDAFRNNQKLRKVSSGLFMEEEIAANNAFGGMLPPSDMTFPAGCEQDGLLAEKLCILAPPKEFDTGDPPQMRTLLDAVKSKPLKPAAVKALDEYVATNWRTNVTLMDLDWERQLKEGMYRTEGDLYSQLAFHPVRVAEQVTKGSVSLKLKGKRVNTIARLAAFFNESVEAAQELIDHASLVVEIICGEVAEVMEKLQFDCYDGRTGHKTRTTEIEGPDLSKFPKTFNRIHLSNIPDYVGGLMNPFLYARPLLKPIPGASLKFNDLLNPNAFKDVDQFHAEYTLLSSEPMVAKQFQLRRTPTNSWLTAFYMIDYMVWSITPANINKETKTTSTNLPFKDLPMTRPELERWLHAWFFKLGLPYPRGGGKFESFRLHSPFNLTLLPRLISHLHQVVGYPAHWLSTILRNLCTGSIATTARPPVTLVAKPSDLDKIYPAKTMNISPYVAELTTLLGLWRPLLPFGFNLPHSATIAPQDIIEARVLFKGGFKWDPELHESRFQLILWNTSLLGNPPNQGMRELLANESGINMLKKKGIHVVSAFKYSPGTQTASFWLREDVIDQVLGQGGDVDDDSRKQDNWMVYIWRTDTWRQQGNGVKTKEFLVKGRKWTDEDSD